MNNNSFYSLVKKYTNIDHEFIDTFFKEFVIGDELDFSIEDQKVSNYLQIKLTSLRRRLNNEFSKKTYFIENVDFVKIKNETSSSNASKTYMLNYPCFERIAMMGDSDRSESVRMYFTKIRQFMVEYQHVIYQSIQNYEELKKYEGFETIYFFVIDEKIPDIIKIGRTKDIIKRLRNYNTGRIHEIDLRYLAIVKNSLLIEKCLSENLIKNKVYKNKEVYKVEPNEIKKIIDYCYCKHVPEKQNDELYDEISQLMGVYNFTKNKVHVKPYIVIDK
jgi:phage anti-repressor protein